MERTGIRLGENTYGIDRWFLNKEDRVFLIRHICPSPTNKNNFPRIGLFIIENHTICDLCGEKLPKHIKNALFFYFKVIKL